MQSLHLADDELSCVDLGFNEVTGADEEVEVSGCDNVFSELAAEWAALVGDGLSVVDLVPAPPTLSNITLSSPPTLTFPVLPLSAAPPPLIPPPIIDPMCIHRRLKDLYSQILTEPFPNPIQHIKRTPLLLERLLEENSFNMVVVTLHPLDKGYSISLRTISGKEIQESVQPYSQNLLLDYINKEELPPIFLDYWETTFPQIFYTGCVLAEVKDARICNPPFITHVLLKPTTQSLINDVTALLLGDSSSIACSSDLRLALEGSVVNNVQPALLLNSSSEEGRRRCNRHHLRKAMLSRSLLIKTNFQNYARSHLDYKMQEQGRHHLYQFISKRKSNPIRQKPIIIKPPPPPKKVMIRPWKDSVEVNCNVTALSRELARISYSLDNTPEIVEQYILETNGSPLSTYLTRLTILQRPASSEYLGTLYVDNQYREGYNNGSLCRFTLGTRANASRYIEQFTEIFTNDGGKSVKITHLVPGEPARVTYTAAMLERGTKLAAAASSNNHTEQLKQLCRTSRLHDPVISTEGNRFRNSVYRFQQPKVAVTSNLTSSLQREVGASIRNTENRNINLSGVSTVPGVSVNSTTNRSQQTGQLHPSVANSSSVLTLLNKTGVATQTPGFTQIQAQQHKLVARKITISNVIGSRFRPVANNNCSIRIPFATIANQLAPQQSELHVRPEPQPLQQTISVQAYGSHFHQLSGVNLKGLKATSTGMRGFVSGSASSQTVQALHMLSASKETVVPQTGQQSNQVASSLSLSMPGLSALLADIESDA